MQGWILLAVVLATIPFDSYATLGSFTSSMAVDAFFNNFGTAGANAITILMVSAILCGWCCACTNGCTCLYFFFVIVDSRF